MVDAVKRARVANMVCHNYRRVPAVALAKQIIDAGEIGDRVYHFRARYAQDWIADENFPLVWRLQSKVAGSGALGDIGAHIIDLARFLVGEIAGISAVSQTFVKKRLTKNRQLARVDVDDAVSVIGRFRNGAILNLEATRFAPGRKNAFSWEINGSKGSLAFDLERLNELEHSEGTKGFRRILVSEADHPFWKWWWPHGHIIGWEHTFVHELHHLLDAIAGNGEVAPHGATLEDGYRAAEVCDAILRAAESGRREQISYR